MNTEHYYVKKDGKFFQGERFDDVWNTRLTKWVCIYEDSMTARQHMSKLKITDYSIHTITDEEYSDMFL
jgi:hypothetical protein